MSFSSRLPNAVPLGDASTLSTHLTLFNPFHILDLRHLLHLEAPVHHSPVPPNSVPNEEDEDETPSVNHVSSSSAPVNQPSYGASVSSEDKMEIGPLQTSPSPVVAMVTKHANGTLNLWHLALSDQSKFTQVLSVSHITRVSGHRFRVNNISCHPVLPLLLTTSHHNVVNSPDGKRFNPHSFLNSFKSRLFLQIKKFSDPLTRSSGEHLVLPIMVTAANSFCGRWKRLVLWVNLAVSKNWLALIHLKCRHLHPLLGYRQSCPGIYSSMSPR